MDVKLDILNAMLASIGSSGITSTIGRHPALIKSTPILERVNVSKQARGHWFNTDWKLKLLPTVEKEFILPQSTLKADTSDKSLPYVRRGRSMYDPIKHSKEIDLESMYLDVVVKLDYDDLPWAFVDLIRTKAIKVLVGNSDMDAISIRDAADNYREAKMAFETERLSQADFTVRDNPNYARIMGGLKGQWSRNSPNNIGG